MKVLCINATPNKNKKLLVEGNVYTVIEEIADTQGLAGYILAEVKNELYPNVGFNKSRFIPLGSIDELDLLEKREDELVKL